MSVETQELFRMIRTLVERIEALELKLEQQRIITAIAKRGTSPNETS